MKYLDTTAGSTHATNVAVQLYMPEAEATAVLAYLDRYQALEAIQPVQPSEADNARLEAEVKRLEAEIQRLRAAQPDPANARAARSASIEALILKALDSATLRADLAAVAPCYRVSKVISHLNRYSARYNIEKAPCRKKVHEVLKQHGYF